MTIRELCWDWILKMFARGPNLNSMDFLVENQMEPDAYTYLVKISLEIYGKNQLQNQIYQRRFRFGFATSTFELRV